MPAILTHDFFARDVLSDHPESIGPNSDERDAFLLGSQGPDPLFFLAMTPKLNRLHALGNIMHDDKPAELIVNLKRSLDVLDQSELPIGRAYAHGFLCHYLLDSTMHPLVFSTEYSLCDAGVEGLTRDDKQQVHAIIESEFDEMVLYRKESLTIADYAPHENTLQASDKVLAIIAKMYVFMALATYGQVVDGGAFPLGVQKYRLTIHYLFHSPTGTKRRVLSTLEETVHRPSILRAMAPRPVKAESTWFENADHRTWEDPFTGRTSAQSFWDIYEHARREAPKAIAAFDDPDFDLQRAHELTRDLNFCGEPVEATITVHHADSAGDGAAASHREG